MSDDLYECPGEAHELDGMFNPSSQGPYGPGYHDCTVCDNTLYVTELVYNAELASQKLMIEHREQQRLINKINSLPKIDY